MDIREKLIKVPNSPGVYLMKDKDGQLLYLGKARQLKKRVSSYFGRGRYQSPRTEALIKKVNDIDFITTATEAEALLLEHSLIKRYLPRYNVTLRDDKSYPFLKLTIQEEFPRLIITRKRKVDGALYYGPFTNVKLLREALKFLRRTFPTRSCRVFPSKPCLYYHIGQCLGPCQGKVTREDYERLVKELRLFLKHGRDALMEEFASQMKELSNHKEFERAAKIRDRIEALSRVKEEVGGVVKLEGARSELKEFLGLARPPHRIEAYDISALSGTYSVGSQVTFVDGDPDKSAYRRFKIKGVVGIDDYQMMREVIQRSFKKFGQTERPEPDLIIIDGGRGHLASALAELKQLGWGKVQAIGIAKELNHIYLPRRGSAVTFPAHSKALYLIQRVRDEAHRFAISYHRTLRKRALRTSMLDEIRGVGPARKRRLLIHFGSISKIVKASVGELLKVDSIDRKTAEAIFDYFR